MINLEGDTLSDPFQFIAQRYVIAILLARGIPPFVYFRFLTFGSIFTIRLFDRTSQQAGVLVALASLLVGEVIQTGWITARFDTRICPLTGANLCIGIGLILIAIASSFTIAGVGVIFLGASFGLLLSLYRSWITELTPEEIRGRVVSIGELLGRVGLTAAPG